MNNTINRIKKLRCKQCAYPNYFDNRSDLVKHQRKRHPWDTTKNVVKSKKLAKKKVVKETTTTPLREVHFCPNCGTNIKAVQAALMI